MTSVIRVKRKRHTEPAEALLLARKKQKPDPCDVPTKSDIADVIKIEQKVFHFAGTVEPELAYSQDIVAEKVQEAILYRKTSKSDVKTTSRKRKLTKLVSEQCNQVNPKIKQLKDCTVAMCQSVLKEKCFNFSPDTKHRKTTTQIKGESKKNEVKPHCDCCTSGTHQKNSHKTGESSEKIMCNNIKMFREKLYVSKTDHKPIAPKQSEFVYDLYYRKTATSGWDMSDLLYVQPYRYNEGELLMQSSSDEEYYYDEDDSNDEDNWRNDYPDEETSSGSSTTSDEEWNQFIQQEEEDLERESDECDSLDSDDFGNSDNSEKYHENERDDYTYYDNFEEEISEEGEDDNDQGNSNEND